MTFEDYKQFMTELDELSRRYGVIDETQAWSSETNCGDSTPTSIVVVRAPGFYARHSVACIGRPSHQPGECAAVEADAQRSNGIQAAAMTADGHGWVVYVTDEDDSHLYSRMTEMFFWQKENADRYVAERNARLTSGQLVKDANLHAREVRAQQEHNLLVEAGLRTGIRELPVLRTRDMTEIEGFASVEAIEWDDPR